MKKDALLVKRNYSVSTLCRAEEEKVELNNASLFQHLLRKKGTKKKMKRTVKKEPKKTATLTFTLAGKEAYEINILVSGKS